MKDEMTDVEKLQNFWMKQNTKQPPTFKDFSRTVYLYTPKYKWQSKLPVWILKLFVKPTTFYDCFPKAIDNICDENGDLSINVSMSFEAGNH